MQQKVVIDTSLALITLHQDDGYFEQVFYAKKNDDIKEMGAYMDTCTQMVEHYDFIPMLVDARAIKGISKEVRDYIRKREKETGSKAEKLAIIVGSGISKITGNMFFSFSKPPYPTKLFTNKEKALEWLLS